MKLNKVSFPYPVWGIEDDYKTPLVCTPPELLVDEESDCYVINMEVLTHNEEIDNLIEHDKAQYVVEIDCAKTFYRQILTTKEPKVSLTIPKTSLRENVVVSFTVTAIVDIPHYVNKDFNDDYKGANIDISKGDVLALITNFEYNVDIRYDALNNVGSFMTIEKDDTNEFVWYNLSSPMIKIMIPSEMFESYKRDVLCNAQYNNIIHASIVFNALVYGLLHLKEFEDDWLWAQTLRYKLDHDDDLQGYYVENIEEVDIIAQIILGNPYKRLFESLQRLTPNPEDE